MSNDSPGVQPERLDVDLCRDRLQRPHCHRGCYCPCGLLYDGN